MLLATIIAALSAWENNLVVKISLLLLYFLTVVSASLFLTRHDSFSFVGIRTHKQMISCQLFHECFTMRREICVIKRHHKKWPLMPTFRKTCPVLIPIFSRKAFKNKIYSDVPDIIKCFLYWHGGILSYRMIWWYLICLSTNFVFTFCFSSASYPHIILNSYRIHLLSKQVSYVIRTDIFFLNHSNVIGHPLGVEYHNRQVRSIHVAPKLPG